MVMLEDDISADLDVAMSVRRDNIPGKRTPDGILTRLANTALGRILKEIETRADPQTIDFGFMLLTLSENAVTGISKAIELTARKARQDGKSHDITVPLSEAATGLTVHCNNDPFSLAVARLRGHCEMRKYTQKADTWFGICLHPVDASLRFGLTLDYEWKPSVKLDAIKRNLPKPENFANVIGSEKKRKIGRNDPCPCGSGLKYKKCCLN